jgi:hypothetical protein
MTETSFKKFQIILREKKYDFEAAFSAVPNWWLLKCSGSAGDVAAPELSGRTVTLDSRPKMIPRKRMDLP